MFDFGMAMGPFSVSDLAGLDIGYKARESLTEAARGPSKFYRVANMLVEQGRLGQKTGAGFYIYDPETRQKQVDDQVMVWVTQAALAEGIQRQYMTDAQIVQRLTQAIIDEGYQVLNDGIAQSASDIDLALIFGYGYPAYLGGPMYMASLE